MPIPSLGVAIQGQNTTSADRLNTYIQTAQNTPQLRTITGEPGMAILLQGVSQPNDGLGGLFYWNAGGTEPDDNMNYIQPPGSTGQWWRDILYPPPGGSTEITFENAGTVVGTADTINAPSGEGTWSVSGGVASYTPPSGGTLALWQPGAPTLADWTIQNSGFIESCTVTQNGTKTVSIVVPPQSTTGAQFGGWSIAAPSEPYQVLFGLSAIGSFVSGAAGGSVAFGWTDLAGKFFYIVLNNVADPLIGYASGGFAASDVSTTTYSPSDDNFITVAPYGEVILKDDGTNVSFVYTVDGISGITLFEDAKSALPLANFDSLFIGVGVVDGPAGSFGAGRINIFLYDPNGEARLPTAPAY